MDCMLSLYFSAENTGRFFPGAEGHDLTVRPVYKKFKGAPGVNAATAFLWMNAVVKWTNMAGITLPGTSNPPNIDLFKLSPKRINLCDTNRIFLLQVQQAP